MSDVIQILRNQQQQRNAMAASQVANIDKNKAATLLDNSGLSSDMSGYQATFGQAKQALINQLQKQMGGTVNPKQFLTDYLQGADAQAIAEKYFPGADMAKTRGHISRLSREYGLPATVIGTVVANHLQNSHWYQADTDLGTDAVDMAFQDSGVKDTLQQLKPIGNGQSAWETTANNMIALATNHANLINQASNLSQINTHMAELSDPRLDFDNMHEDTKQALTYDYNRLSDAGSRALVSYTNAKDTANAFANSIIQSAADAKRKEEEQQANQQRANWNNYIEGYGTDAANSNSFGPVQAQQSQMQASPVTDDPYQVFMNLPTQRIER